MYIFFKFFINLLVHVYDMYMKKLCAHDIPPIQNCATIAPLQGMEPLRDHYQCYFLALPFQVQAARVSQAKLRPHVSTTLHTDAILFTS
jgi:hypothetical protein